MGHNIMPVFAFRMALSEDAGVRWGFPLTEANTLAHLPAPPPLREGLGSDSVLRVQSEDYAETIGDLLHEFGAVEQSGMLTPKSHW